MDDIARTIGLTFDKWKEYKLWCFNPINVSKQTVDAWRTEQKNKAASRRQERRRDQQRRLRRLQRAHEQLCRRAAQALPPREAAIAAMMTIGQPISVPEMARRASKLDAFKHAQHSGTTWLKPPPHVMVKDLRKIVRRTLMRLQAKGYSIDLRNKAARHGGCVTWATLRAVPAAERPRDTETAVRLRKAA